MKYGCIGEHLGHSFSREIHARLGDYEYGLCELRPSELSGFMSEREFLAINVTIPYKQDVIPYLDFIDPDAEAIGAVNTIVNREGKLYGYNTDFYGMRALIDRIGATPCNKKAVILGTGGTARTARRVLESYGARKIITVGRRRSESNIDYSELYEKHTDAEYIINTTPVGMFPATAESPIDLTRFNRLIGVCDAVYNPLRTTLVSAAQARGICAEGGLYMLVAQAVRASEIFLGKSYGEGTLDKVFNEVYSSKENIVLVGMPASGKTTVGKILADMTSRKFIDTDDIARRIGGAPIREIFNSKGEEYFRDIEAQAVNEAAAEVGCIIATGGGAILRSGNIAALKKNGRIVFIDRPLDALVPTEDRPLSRDRAAILELYSKRYGIYCAVSDIRIDATIPEEGVAKKILEEIRK